MLAVDFLFKRMLKAKLGWIWLRNNTNARLRLLVDYYLTVLY
jgi:hypothetical protein